MQNFARSIAAKSTRSKSSWSQTHSWRKFERNSSKVFVGKLSFRGVNWSSSVVFRLNGYLLSIGKIQLLSKMAQTYQDEPNLWIPVRMNIILFVPERARRVQATISRLGKKHIGKEKEFSVVRLKSNKHFLCLRVFQLVWFINVLMHRFIVIRFHQCIIISFSN